jgi:polysaccharide biosynthesis/export protein
MRPRITTRILSHALLLLACVGTLTAQNIASTQNDDFQLRRRVQKFTTLETLKTFEQYAPPSFVYGEGDEVTVEVFGHPELSGKHLVGPDGIVTLPVVGDLHLSGLTREEALGLVRSSFTKFYEGLSIVLRTEVYASNRVFVLGRVSSPGVLHFDSTPTLLEAIARAGGLPVGGFGGDKAALNRCVIFRGRDAVVWVDLKPLFKEGNLAYNIQLKRNDVIYLPDSDDQNVYVMGEVLRPGAFALRPDMTFMDAFAAAGGATNDAVTEHIRLIRPSKGVDREIAMKDLMRPNPALNFVLVDGDIILVPKRRLAKFGYLVEQFGPASGLAIVGKQIAP